MLAEHISHGSIGKSLAKAHAARNLRYDPPIRFCLTWRLQEWTLSRDTPLRIGDRAFFLSPGGRRQQNLRPCINRVVRDHVVGNYKEIEFGQRIPNGSR